MLDPKLLVALVQYFVTAYICFAIVFTMLVASDKRVDACV
jgi:hypothetical protein